MAQNCKNKSKRSLLKGRLKKEKTPPNQAKQNQNLLPPPPFPSRFQSTKKEKEDQEIMETFRKVEVNIPLLDAIKQVPRYAMFLKELCTSKKKLKGTKPSSIPRAMLDLGASINVLPYSIFKTLNVGPLKRTGVVIQSADKSTVHLKGVLEDVLVQVNELVFTANFYVLDMEDDDTSDSSSILLGRPFLKTAKTNIDVYSGTLSMEFDGEIINFNIYDAMRYPSDFSSMNWLDVIDPLTDDYFELSNCDSLALVLNKSLDKESTKELAEKFQIEDELIELVSLMDTPTNHETQKLQIQVTNKKLIPSIVQAPELELKTLPDHLKYAYLGDDDMLPVIISNKLSKNQEDELINMLKQYKEAIGLTIADIKGLSPSLCMHKILMEDDYKPIREAQ
ncbi:uncharacterized protein LOC110900932 [Helianthus annuus]|uniref:uncharacterized protein LOC110900932 n=1 Tax=Helianthus annuus TaxID=4232 RepID=UPI000B8F9B81|nr:uncharacterized protein LOC110900932 [Helianthus annuus]